VSGNHRLETRFTLETFEADVRTSCLSVSAQEESFDARLKAGSFGLKPKIVLYYGASATQEVPSLRHARNRAVKSNLLRSNPEGEERYHDEQADDLSA
jgi:hypothetical protein